MGGISFKDGGTQCGGSKGSYQRHRANISEAGNVWDDMRVFVTYDELLKDVLMTKELTIKWLMKEAHCYKVELSEMWRGDVAGGM